MHWPVSTQWRRNAIIVAAAGVVLALGSLSLKPARAVDGSAARPVSTKEAALTPLQALQKYREDLLSGHKASSLAALQYAADGGQPLAEWKLGTMYRTGDGVPKDDLKAFQYFSRVVDGFDEDQADWREEAVASSAFVAVGSYYLEGIAGGKLAPDPGRAMQMFHYAATTFGDPEAQYDLARMYLDGVGARRDPEQAARWLNLAADKGHKDAEALLGNLLFKGDGPVQPQRALGLMYLTLAREAALNTPADAWIVDLDQSALQAASDADKVAARRLLENYVRRAASGVTAQR